MARLGQWLVLACGLLASLNAVRAQGKGGGQEPHFLTNMPAAGQVSTGFMFPDSPDKQFPAGKMASVVLGMRNEGSDPYNVTMIAGSLNSPADFSVHIQNFTQMGYGQVLAPGQEASFEYKFYPDPRLEPRDFLVALSVFYSDDKGKWFSSTFFNETVNIVEVKQLIDWELLFLLALFSAGVAAAVYMGYSYVVGQGWLKATKKRRGPRTSGEGASAPMSAADQQEWLKGTPYDEFVRNKQRAATRRPAAAAKE